MLEAMIASIGLIRRMRDDMPLWLLKQSQNQPQFAPIVAERLEGESGRTSLDREISWILDLESGRDYIISSVARLNYDTEFTRQGDVQPTVFSVEFYVVELYGKHWPRILDADATCRWVTTSELVGGTLTDGNPVDTTICTLINKAGVLVGC